MKQFFITIVILLTGFNAQAISEREFIERLKATHPFFEQQALSSQIKQVEKRLTTANEDWVISINGNYKNENASDISSSTYNKLNTTSADVSATRKIANSGSDITFKHAWKDKNKDVNTTRNRFSLDYTYPLLRNRDGVNDQLDGDVAQIAIEKNTLERLEQEEDFILKKLKRFVDLAYAQEQQLINERRLALAGQELNLVKQKFAASVVDKVDVLLQEDAYQRAQQQLLQAQQDLILLRHEIAITLALNFDQVVANTDLYKIYSAKEVWLLADTRALKITALDQKTLKRQLFSFKNESQAKLDLNLGLASEGENSSYSNSLENQSATWNVGLDWSYPLGGVKSSNNVKKAEIKLARLAQYKREQLLELNVQATILKEKIKLLMQMLKSNKKQISIAKARTVEERGRYANGSGQASFVISAQNNEQNAQLGYAQVATNYQKAVLDFKATIDQLVR
ncbi:MAG TPA: TolC family protein [Gammaproteobacteria bacterium]|nr:TolC family protein [Gammaproteobacteria bacterium]